jgi:hypothetical protein
MTGACVGVTLSSLLLAIAILLAALLYRWSRASTVGFLFRFLSVLAALFVMLTVLSNQILWFAAPSLADAPVNCTSVFWL